MMLTDWVEPDSFKTDSFSLDMCDTHTITQTDRQRDRKATHGSQWKVIIQRTVYRLEGLIDIVVFFSHLWWLYNAVSHIQFHLQCFIVSFILCHVNPVICRWALLILQFHCDINMLICVLSICMNILFSAEFTAIIQLEGSVECSCGCIVMHVCAFTIHIV